MKRGQCGEQEVKERTVLLDSEMDSGWHVTDGGLAALDSD